MTGESRFLLHETLLRKGGVARRGETRQRKHDTMRKLVFACAATATLVCGCATAQETEKAVAAEAATAGETQENEWSVEAANRNLAGLVQALLARDTAAAKPFFVFPITRPGLLPDVEEKDFESYFPTLFDDGFFAEFEPLAKGTNLWEQFGWRGFYAGDLLWSSDAKRITGVLYEAPEEAARLKALEHAEFMTLAPPLRDDVTHPRFAFATEDGAWRGRLDDTQNGGNRIALWRKGNSLAAMPDVVCQVNGVPEGNIGTIRYFPEDLKAAHPFVCLGDEIYCDGEPTFQLVMQSPNGKSDCLSDDGEPWSGLAVECLPFQILPWEELRRSEAEKAVAAEVETTGESAPETAAPADGESKAPESASDIVRRHLRFMEVHFDEEDRDGATTFTYHLSSSPESVEEYRMQVDVEDGSEFAACTAILPLNVPAARLGDVAVAVAEWAGTQPAGQFGVDFDRRAVFFRTKLPTDALRRADGLTALTFFGMPMIRLSEKDAEIRAIVKGMPMPAAEEDSDGVETTGGGDGGAAASVANVGIGKSESDGGTEAEATTTVHDAGVSVEDLVLAWIRRRGLEPTLADADPVQTTFQFPVGLTESDGPFTEAMALVTVMEKWVCAFVSPSVRFPAEQRAEIAKEILKLSNEEDGVFFQWIGTDRIAARAVLPAAEVERDPDRSISRLLNLAGEAVNRRGADILRAAFKTSSH